MQITNKTYFTVGPSQLYPGMARMIQKALDNGIGSISHRSDKFRKIYQQTKQALIDLLNIPIDYQVLFLGSSLEIMERIITSCVEQNCVHLVNGAFGEKFWQTAVNNGKKARKIDYDQNGFNPNKLNIPKKTEMICLTQNETSTGVAIPETVICKLKRLNPKPLLTVDIVSSAPTVNLDWQLIDLGFFSGQKGFGLPAGLAVLIVSPRAIIKARQLAKSGKAVIGFHNLAILAEKETDQQTPETPNVLGIYLLGKVINKMIKKTLKVIRQETDAKAKLLNNLTRNGVKWRSRTTIVIDVDFPNTNFIQQLTEMGFVVSDGYGENKGKQIRIANFPAHSITQVKKLCQRFNLL